MNQKENPFEQVARPLRDLTHGLTRMQAATLLGDDVAGATLLLHTQSMPQGDSTLYVDAQIPSWEGATAQALLDMHMQVHLAAVRLRTALMATTD
jgi:hypothetical protein